MSKRVVFNVSFFELASNMYWCLFGNAGSIASKLSIIAINPGHSYVKSRWLSRFYCHKTYLSSIRSFAILYLFTMSLDKKMHLHKFAPGQIFCKKCENWGVNVGKCPICLAIYTPSLFWYANVSFTIFAAYLLLSFYILRHIYKEQICANPFFSSSG